MASSSSLLDAARSGNATEIRSIMESARAEQSDEQQAQQQQQQQQEVSERSQQNGDAMAGSDVDINAKDSQGSSALVLAASGGHEEAVRELLARGADRQEALAAGYGEGNSAVASAFHDINLASHDPAAAGHLQMFGPVPTDIYGGYQLPDGSIAYGNFPVYPPPSFPGAPPGQPAFYHDPVMFPHHHPHHQFGPQSPYPPPMVNGNGSYGARDGRSRSVNGMPPFPHGSKPVTSGKLPPPEVAKQIPCKFYPNCRNGSNCIFAHVDGPNQLEVSRPEGAEAPSPSSLRSPPPSNGHYHAPPGPSPYPPPPPFYLMGQGNGPHFIPYGPPMTPMPLHYQPQEGSQPGQMTPVAPAVGPSQGEDTGNEDEHEQSVGVDAPTREDEVAHVQSAPVNGETTSSVHPGSEQDDGTTPQQQSVEGQQTDAEVSDGKSQSFGSVLHSQATPFQPSQVMAAAVPIPVGPAGMSSHAYNSANHAFGARGKMRGRGGAMGAVGRGKHERGPCTFFARNSCRYGSECLFPHVLPDGTDARRLGGGASNAVVAHQRQQNVQQGANGTVDGDGKSIAANPSRQPPTAPLGPRAKRDAGLPATPSSEVTTSASPQIGQVGEASGTAAGKKQSSNGVVPSKPSATLLAGTASSNNGEGVSAEKPEVNGDATPRAPQAAPQANQNGPRKSNSSKGASSAAQQKKAVTAPQRIPNRSDFPALAGAAKAAAVAPNSSQAPSQASHSDTDDKQATGAAKPFNFSAALSAPAPAKKAVDAASPNQTAAAEPAEVASTDATEDNKAVETPSKAGVENSEHSPNGAPAQSEKVSQPNGKPKHNKGSNKAWGSKTASAPAPKAPVVDADDFQLVKGRNHSKRNHSNGPSSRSGSNGVSAVNGSASADSISMPSKAALAA